MDNCSTCNTRYVCEGKHEFDCKQNDYFYYNKDNEKYNELKTRYDKKEQQAFLHGYLYGKAEEMKDQGLFENLTTKEIVGIICEEIVDEI